MPNPHANSNLFITKAFFWCLLIVSTWACSWVGPKPSFEDDFITYKISKDKHEIDGDNITLFKADRLKFQAVFDSSAIYKSFIPENQYDINKLMGFSDCNSPHHGNSARFGWNWMDNALHIHAYTYVDGQRVVKSLGTVTLNETNTYEIQIQGNEYVFLLNGAETRMQRFCSGSVGLAYNLLPYFGGDETAPHDIKIKIRLLE
ncbi:hypothetical protein [Dyadobacter tibetensis]|uniref:hypothetical protein n=1 Tax=Dyadobacter tibetensis TaxID=1211851 RepID=UPI0005C59254|nr:hypothetical protein [Dyadobacter tibetensis]